MKKASSSLGENLVFEGLLTKDQFQQIQDEVSRTREPFYKALRRLGFVDEKRLLSFMSAKFRIPEVQITHQIVKPQILKLIPDRLVRKFSIVPLRKIGKRLCVATSDPLNLNTLDQLRHASGFEIEPMLATESEIRNAIEQFYGMKSQMSDVVDVLRGEPNAADKKKEKPDKKGKNQDGVEAAEAPIIKLVNKMIEQAAQQGVSDIHIEPDKDKVIVRYRVDGILQEVDQYPTSSHPSVISRIKVMSNLDISENRIPQDGRVQVNAGGSPVDLRISVMPTIHGENLVMRVLNLSNAVISLKKLGMSDENLVLFRQLIVKPHGILLLTGPTGSGKTTTLYAAINQINSVDKNIVTIEDPVEYQLPLVRQIQVNAKVNLTFANGLRSVLRQDPDVIMVGEIRDRETAEIAIQAALTGHLVFSTLHTNDAASAVTRLVEMGVEPFLVASTVTGIIAQRLVRNICGECSESLSADEATVARLNAASDGVKWEKGSKVHQGRGCLSCRKSGYRGRSGIFEFLVPDDEIRKMILKKLSSNEIATKAIDKGMRTLRRDGLEKIKAGVTTVDEVMRATQQV